MAKNEPLFQHLDCLEFYVSDLQKGVEYYRDKLGLKILWKTDTAIGLGMADGITEIVIQNERKRQEADIKVKSVPEAVERIKEAGGEIVHGPFEIAIGQCAVVKDPWGNRYVILDTTKGTYITDDEGNILGQKIPEA